MSFSAAPTESFDVIVVGGGHAGCEAAITAARLGLNTALFSLNLDRIAWQPCNPAVGGPAKSQLVHEVDALGGVIGRLADATAIQKRILNASRGQAIPLPESLGQEDITTSGLLYDNKGNPHFLKNNQGQWQWKEMQNDLNAAPDRLGDLYPLNPQQFKSTPMA